MPGSFVISLDFELMWGVRDHRSVAEYGDAILGVRQAVPEMLRSFSTHGIRASWATVGFLFARNRSELLEYLPAARPDYLDSTLSPYRHVQDGLGQDENDDPHHYAASLLDQVAQTDGQDIGSHTFSHYYCLEEGQTEAAFEADVVATNALALARGHQLRSLVFPRNQMTPAHIQTAAQHGQMIYRGNPNAWAYRPRSRSGTSQAMRAFRLADGALPLANGLAFDKALTNGAALNVPASRFLRPWNRKMPLYTRFHIKRIQGEMTRAAKTGRHYHLWWHPHNFGRNTAANMDMLHQILNTFRHLQDRYGFESRNMTDFADAPLNSDPV